MPSHGFSILGGHMAKIWLVDDNQNLANLTKIALVKNGHEVIVVFMRLLKSHREGEGRKARI